MKIECLGKIHGIYGDDFILIFNSDFENCRGVI